MSPQRVADAARISPYPFVVHQVPSAPPENGDPSRPAKGKKKPKQRPERSNQQEEESRFNIGPVRPGTYGIRRSSRQAGRSHPDDRSRELHIHLSLRHLISCSQESLITLRHLSRRQSTLGSLQARVRFRWRLQRLVQFPMIYRNNSLHRNRLQIGHEKK